MRLSTKREAKQAEGGQIGSQHDTTTTCCLVARQSVKPCHTLLEALPRLDFVSSPTSLSTPVKPRYRGIVLELHRFRIGLGGSRKRHVFSLSPLGTWIGLWSAASYHLSASDEDPGTLGHYYTSHASCLYNAFDCD
jgi:hypothetical protein